MKISVEGCFSRIDDYLKSNSSLPLLIDVPNGKTMQQFLQRYRVEGNTILPLSNFCSRDNMPREDELINEIERSTGNLFVTEISAFYMLFGMEKLKQFLSQLIKRPVRRKVVFMTYQSYEYCTTEDPRYKGNLYEVEGEMSSKPHIVFVAPDLKVEKAVILDGIDKIAGFIETKEAKELYVHTDRVSNVAFRDSMFAISDLRSAYDALVVKDSKTGSIPEMFGTEEQWAYATEQFGECANWAEMTEKVFGVQCMSLQYCLSRWASFDSNKKWLCFIAMKMFGVHGNSILNNAVRAARSIDEMIEHIYADILEIGRRNKDFAKLYSERKELLKELGDETKAGQFCNKVLGKGIEGLYYLTDLTEKERELIVTLCGEEGFKPEMLQGCYPDLFAYMKPYYFDIPLLDRYFQQYKLCKLTNRISDELLKTVNEQAVKRDFITLLQPRSSKVEQFATNDCVLYFIDALGVEYLAFITEKCRELGMTSKVTVCRCELPSLTRFNKEFIVSFKGHSAKLVGEESGIKDLDEIKHRVTLKYDYTQTKAPIHLCVELEIISDVLRKIKQALEDGRFKSAVIVSDHGASRLAVIHEQGNCYEMTEKGEHSGRCCPKSGSDFRVPDCVTEANDYWAIANYDRFKGGRAASVEVHGGATLEEVTVPIIDITLGVEDIKIITPKVEYSRKKPVRIQITASRKLADNSFVRVKDEKYALKAVAGGTLLYETGDLCCIKRAGKYSVEVFDGNMSIGTVDFEAENRGMKINDEF